MEILKFIQELFFTLFLVISLPFILFLCYETIKREECKKLEKEFKQLMKENENENENEGTSY